MPGEQTFCSELVNTTVGSTPNHGKNAIEIYLSLKEEISMKQPSSTICEAKISL